MHREVICQSHTAMSYLGFDDDAFHYLGFSRDQQVVLPVARRVYKPWYVVRPYGSKLDWGDDQTDCNAYTRTVETLLTMTAYCHRIA